MKMIEACNLYVPTGATPMTIADAILRECDDEILQEVLYYIDCFMKKNGLQPCKEDKNAERDA